MSGRRVHFVQRHHSELLQGSGRVQERRLNNFRLTGVASAEIVLMSHYVPDMVAEPPARIDGVRMLDASHLFVRIANRSEQLRPYLP